MPNSVTLRDFDGNVVSVPEAQAQDLLDRGYTPETDAQGLERTAQAAQEEMYGGVGGALKAGVAGALSGLTLGATDQLGAALGARQALRGLQEENPVTSIGANIAGAVIPAILTAGASTPGTAAGLGARILARTPAALASRAGIAAGEAVAGAGAGLGARIAAGATGAAVEGALEGGGQYLAQMALQDKPLSAEGFVAGMGLGAVFAAPIGGAFTAGERALIRARKLFPKSEVSAEAARGVKQQAVSEIATAASDGDAMAAAAAHKLAQADAAVGMAEAGEQTTRRLFGAADPASLSDQVTSGLKRQQLGEALQDYRASRAELDNWIRTEADLDDVLADLKAPEVGRVLEYGDLGTKIEDLTGSRAKIDSEIAESQRLAQGTPAPGAKSKADTAVGRRPGALAEGTPPPDAALREALDMPTGVGRKPVSAPPELISGVSAGGVSVPLMVTQKMKSQLRDLGYTANEIFEMRPAQAWEAINAGPRVGRDATVAGSRPALTPSANAGASLEDLLAGTKARLDAGESLSEIGAASPLRRDYVTGKELDTGRPLTQRADAAPQGIPDHSTIKAHEAKADDYLEQTVSASELAKRGYYEPPGAHGDAVRSANAAKAIKEGQREPIQLNVSPSGKITVTNGRHRLKAAIDADAPIKVQWSTGAEPAADDVLRGGSAAGTEFSVDHKFLGPTPMRLTSKTRDVGGNKITEVKVFRQSESGEPMFVGEARFTHQGGKLLPDEVTVDGPFQRLGIGTRMYKAAEDGTGLRVMPGKQQTEAGKAFSAKYRGAAPGPTSFTKIDRPAGGSQGGAWYRDSNGDEWFGKTYRGDTDRLEGEHLASQIYRKFGVSAPETRIVNIDGKRVLLSKEIKGKQADNTQVLRGTDVKKGFVVDAWLGNRDVIGTGKDNIIVSGDKAHRIDAGGATIWRATGGDKTFVAKVKELESMRDPSREAGRVFGQLSPDEVKQQLDEFVKTYESKQAEIDKLIDDSGLSDAAKEKIKIGLNDRAAWLKTEAKGKPPDLTDDEFNAYASSSAQTLPDDIRDSMLRYSGQGTYARVNKRLREGKGKVGLGNLDEDAIPVIENIDRGMSLSPVPRDIVVYRGINGATGVKAATGLKPGDVFVDHGFGSTSYLEDIGQEYAKGFGVNESIQFHISVPKGHPAFPIPSQFPKEREILLARGGRYIVTDVSTAPNGHKIIKMTVRAPDKFAPKPVPPGYAMDAVNEYGPLFDSKAHVRHGLPEYNEMEGVGPNKLIIVARPSELAGKQLWGKAKNPEVISAPNGGTPPVRIGFDRGQNGQTTYLVYSGENALLEAARNGDKPIVISLRRSAGTRNFQPIAEDLEGALAAAVPVKLPDETGLEGLARVARTARGELDELPAETGLESLTRLQRGALSEAERTPAAQGDDLTELLAGTKRALDSGQSLRGIAGGELPAETGLEGLIRAQRAASVPDDLGQQILGPQITKVLGKRAGGGVDMGPDLARAAQVINGYEHSLANLADALGSDAPTTAVQRAKAYREAVAAQSDSMAASAAKAAEDLSQRTTVDSEITKALQQAQMRAPDRTVVDPIPAGLSPAATATAATADRRTGKFGLLADVGTALEVLQSMGVGVPDIDRIPVIGPVLSLYLKARAVMGILGRRGGSIGRSADSIVAGKSAAVRDRLASATDAILSGSAKATRAAARPAVAAAAILGVKLFPGGEEPKSKDPQVLYEARADEISRALQPGAIARAVDDRILTADAQLQQAISGQVERGLRFIDSKMPRQTVLPGMLPGDGNWKPSRYALETWGRYIRAVNDPISVLEDLARGQVTIEGAETLRTVYPRLFAEAQRLLLEAAPKMQKTLPYARRRTISILYQVPIDSTMTPQHMQFLQTARQANGVQNTPQPGAPAMTAPLQIGQQMMPSLDRRAGA